MEELSDFDISDATDIISESEEEGDVKKKNGGPVMVKEEALLNDINESYDKEAFDAEYYRQIDEEEEEERLRLVQQLKADTVYDSEDDVDEDGLELEEAGDEEKTVKVLFEDNIVVLVEKEPDENDEPDEVVVEHWTCLHNCLTNVLSKEQKKDEVRKEKKE